MFDLFLSHSSAQKRYANELSTELAGCGIRGFVAHDDIEPTDEWRDTIVQELSSCKALLIVCTRESGESPWCNQEIGWAFGRGTPVFSLRRGGDPVAFASRFQAIRAVKGDVRKTAGAIADVISKNSSTVEAYGEALAAWLRAAESWEQIRDCIGPSLGNYNWSRASNEMMSVLEDAMNGGSSHAADSYYLGRVRSELRKRGLRVPPEP